jgi:glutamate dehydrogenase
MPFLLSSIVAELNQRACIRFIAHPILWVQRGDDGRATDVGTERVAAATAAGERAASRSSASPEAAQASPVCAKSREVRVVVNDWKPMLARLREAIDAYSPAAPVAVDDLAESIQFLKWLADLAILRCSACAPSSCAGPSL